MKFKSCFKIIFMVNSANVLFLLNLSCFYTKGLFMVGLLVSVSLFEVTLLGSFLSDFSL